MPLLHLIAPDQALTTMLTPPIFLKVLFLWGFLLLKLPAMVRATLPTTVAVTSAAALATLAVRLVHFWAVASLRVRTMQYVRFLLPMVAHRLQQGYSTHRTEVAMARCQKLAETHRLAVQTGSHRQCERH